MALPVNTPKLGSGLAGNVDTVSGLRLDVTTHVSGNSSVSRAGQGRAASVAGGTPTRTGTISPGCATTTYPLAVASSAGLFPNQILSAYGIASLQAGGLKGQGIRVAILGEAPTPGDDVTAYRNCFGFQGTTLKIHGGSGITPILESSLDAMTLAMVAPKLARLDLWVKALGQNDPQGALELLAEPLQATTNGTPLPNVISISYGICEASVKPYSAARTLFNRQLAATSALGITTVVAAGDSGSSSCAHGVPSSQLDSFDKQKSASWPATSPWVLAVGGTNLTLTPANSIESSGVWNDTKYPSPYEQTAAGGGGVSTFEDRPWWQPATSSQKTYRMVPDVAAFADPSPGYVIICSQERSGLRTVVRPDDRVRRRHECGYPARGGHDRALGSAGQAIRAAQAGIRPTASLLARSPHARLRSWTSPPETTRSSATCRAAPRGSGYDMASGLGSPLADQIAKRLHH